MQKYLLFLFLKIYLADYPKILKISNFKFPKILKFCNAAFVQGLQVIVNFLYTHCKDSLHFLKTAKIQYIDYY